MSEVDSLFLPTKEENYLNNSETIKILYTALFSSRLADCRALILPIFKYMYQISSKIFLITL